MNGAVQRVRLIALLVVACAHGAELAAQDNMPRVDGAQFECAELERMVRSARRLSITALHVNPHSGDRESTNTFVAGPAYCRFLDEWPSQWKIRARNGEVCLRLYICLPRDIYDDPLWGGWR